MTKSLASSLLFCTSAIFALGADPPAEVKRPMLAGAPTLGILPVTGIQRGQTLDLMLPGEQLVEATGIALPAGLSATMPADPKNSPINLHVKIEARPDAPLGAHPLRVATRCGISNLRLFCVDDLPQVAEVDSNHARASAQSVPVPCVVMGRAEPAQADWFRIKVAAGQRLSFDLLGRRLGSAIDAQLFIHHPATGHELAHDNDSPGCQGDPRLRYTFKEAGEYLIEVRDVLNRGGPEFFYRLRIGTFPLACASVPMAARRGSKVKVAFAGPAVDDTPAVEVAMPTDPGQVAVSVTPPGMQAGWPVTLLASDHDEQVEQEPNDEPAKANRLPVPGGVTGRLQASGDSDCFIFQGKKAQALVLEARTLDLGAPSLVYLVLRNAKTGAEIAHSNPQAPPPADQRLDFTPPEDADYVVEVQHLYFGFGPSEAYHLDVRPAQGFELGLIGERVTLDPGGATAHGISVQRHGYDGPIELGLVAANGLAGTGEIRTGQNTGLLLLRAAPDRPLGQASAAVIGRAKIDGRDVTAVAGDRPAVSAQLAEVPYPPLQVSHELAVAVIQKPPFALAFKASTQEAIAGSPASLTVGVARAPGFDDEILFDPPVLLPPGVPAPKIPNVPKDKQEVGFGLDINGKVPHGTYPLLLSAKLKLKEGEFRVNVPPIDLVVGPPFVLKAEPAVVNLHPGDKVKLKVSATRRAGYKGIIALAASNLPAGVTAEGAKIAAGAQEAEIEVVAGPMASPVDKTDVRIGGTATELNNIQNATPPFTIRIQKK